MQFLESVDKDSNADKAGLKPLDFVLEINGIDVSCKTHFECVKLIKKTGDTLALKVFTVDYSARTNSLTSNQQQQQMTAMSTIYQTPSSQTPTNKQYSTSASYYATTTIAPSSSMQHSLDYIDGTKSLSNKNKRVTSLKGDIGLN